MAPACSQDTDNNSISETRMLSSTNDSIWPKLNDLHPKDKMTGLIVEHNSILPSFSKSKPNTSLRVMTPLQHEHNEVDSGNMDYRFEEARLRSFENWPSQHVRPADLAAAGFYYTQDMDRVCCFECKLTMGMWEEGDNPMSEHQRWGGRCRFIRKLPCGNVPIGADPSTIPPPPPRGNDVCGFYGLDYRLTAEADTHASSSQASSSSVQNHQQLPSATQLGCLGISVTKKPNYPEYQNYETRLATFEKWPTTNVQKKEDMAMAGFFYAGYGDKTTCYHCGGGLERWEPEDDPWEQHAKWYPNCLYVKVVQGQEFINSISGKEIPSISEEEIKKLNLPGYIKKVDSSTAQKSERKEPVQEPTPMEACKSTPGPSTAPPIPMPCTKLKESAAAETAVTNSSNVSEEQMEQQPQVQAQAVEKKPTDDACAIESSIEKEADVKTETKEKDTKIEGTVSLEEENRRLKEARQCKICMDKEVAVVFLPCSHLSTCVNCAPSLTHCPLCRHEIQAYIRAFLA